MTTDTAWSLEAASATATRWVDHATAQGAAFAIPMSVVEGIATDLATRLAEPAHQAYVEFQPGNSTNYAVAVLLLPDEVAAGWGGKLLVALPEWSEGGRAVAFGLGYDLDPDMVCESLRLRPADGMCVAVLLTLLSGALADVGVS